MLGRVLVRFPARLPRSVLQPQHGLNPVPPIVLPIRSYATPGRPKSVVGEPSRPVKRNVKKAAAKPRDGSTAAEKKVAAAKKRTAKPRAKTPEQLELAANKAAAQKERLAKRKVAQKAATKVAADKVKLQELKKTALDPPKQKALNSAYLVYFTEKMKAAPSSKDAKLGELGKKFGAEWKTISAADREHYNHVLHTMNEEQQSIYKRWLESHTPDQIQKANDARAQLRRKYPKQKNKWAKIADERAPKRPRTPFVLFNTNRQASGDFNGIKLAEASKLIGQEWKALSSSEKEKYEKIYKDDAQRYASEYSSIFGRALPGATATASA